MPPANATVHRYTGRWDKQYDTTSSLVLMGARPYDPNLGRFLAVDPIDGGSLNNYDYAGQDPVNGYDLAGTINGDNGLLASAADFSGDPIGGIPHDDPGKPLVLGLKNTIDESGFRGAPGYETLNLREKGPGRWRWSKNAALIQNAIDEGRPIMLLDDPNQARYAGGNTYAREIRYLPRSWVQL